MKKLLLLLILFSLTSGPVLAHDSKELQQELSQLKRELQTLEQKPNKTSWDDFAIKERKATIQEYEKAIKSLKQKSHK